MRRKERTMPEKRKDSKGRNLRDGELQRNDGRYEYRYFDQNGQKHSVYSWQLVDTDKIPAGKRCKESLRAMEKRINKDLEEGIRTQATNKMCLNDYFEGYFAGKRELKQSTRNNYRYMYDKYIKDGIGGKLEVDGPDKFPCLYEALHRAGISHRVLEKMWRDNILRLL